MIGNADDQPLEKRMGARRIAADGQSAGALVKHERVIREYRLGLAEQPLRLGIAALAEQALDVRHECRDSLLVATDSRLAHVHWYSIPMARCC